MCCLLASCSVAWRHLWSLCPSVWLTRLESSAADAKCVAVAAYVLSCHSAAYVCSFCWGGLYAVLLAQGQTPKVAAAVVYHGSAITPADVEAVTVPLNFQQSDPTLDRQIGPELYKQVGWWSCSIDCLLCWA